MVTGNQRVIEEDVTILRAPYEELKSFLNLFIRPSLRKEGTIVF
jgi:hypothetical protein